MAIDESALTGESAAVAKTVDRLAGSDLPIGDQTNRAWMGTMAVRGRGELMVTATGMQTQLGKIAGSLQAVQPKPTPLQRHLGQLSRGLAAIAILIVGLVFIVGLAAGHPTRLMLMTALSMAVAIVPEGLPAVATVALALGARRMVRRHALIRQLPAVETLGSVSVICSDKTGTLTQNRMTANTLAVTGCQIANHENPQCAEDSGVQLLLIGGCLCNDARMMRNRQMSSGPAAREDSNGKPRASGDPTETALVEVAARYGLEQQELQSLFPRRSEIAFDSVRKRMATLHDVRTSRHQHGIPLPGQLRDASRVVFVKGAFDHVLGLCSRVWIPSRPEPLDPAGRSRLEQIHDDLASAGARVLAVAFRPVSDTETETELERDLVFVGMFGLSDPPRPEAKSAVVRCRQAGIRPVMITGDHPLTAITVARQLGIGDDESAVTGRQLKQMTDATLREQVGQLSVFARVTPADKLRIVQALQRNDEVVAMTGDGVNDAPALKQAHIGVAMGQTGTDVARQASSMVLLDDNFATIVAAVEQGRIVYDNIRKFVRYTMSSNAGEILVMTLGLLWGLPLPLLPLQILWINLVTDGLPGLALATEPAEKNTMNRPPIAAGEPIFNWKMTRDVLVIGFLIGIASLVTANLMQDPRRDVDHWRTMLFTVLTFSQLGNALACRSEYATLWNMGAARNWWLWSALGSMFLMQLAVIYLGPLQTVFHTRALSAVELLVCLGASCLVFLLIEFRKWAGSWRRRPASGQSG